MDNQHITLLVKAEQLAYQLHPEYNQMEIDAFVQGYLLATED